MVNRVYVEGQLPRKHRAFSVDGLGQVLLHSTGEKDGVVNKGSGILVGLHNL